MSLLLDALKKSDQERRQQEIASLGNLPFAATRAAPKRSWVLPLIAVIALAAAGAYGYSYLQDQKLAGTQSELKAAQERINSARAREAERRAANSQKDQVALRDEIKQQTLAQTQRPLSNEAMMQAIAANSNPSIINNSENYGVAPQPLPSAVSQPVPGNPAPLPALTDALNQANKAAGALPEDKPREPSKAASSSSPISAEPVSADEARWRALPRSWDLPFGTRQSLPGTALNMHVYARDPLERVVMINMESGREGAMLKTGLVIREITPMGVVVDYQGTEFFIEP